MRATSTAVGLLALCLFPAIALASEGGFVLPDIDPTKMNDCVNVTFNGVCKQVLGDIVPESDYLNAMFATVIEEAFGPMINEIAGSILQVSQTKSFAVCDACLNSLKAMMCYSIVPGCGFNACIETVMTDFTNCFMNCTACASDFGGVDFNSGDAVTGAMGAVGGAVTGAMGVVGGAVTGAMGAVTGFGGAVTGAMGAVTGAMGAVTGGFPSGVVSPPKRDQMRLSKRSAVTKRGELNVVENPECDACMQACDSKFVQPACGKYFIGQTVCAKFVDTCSCGHATVNSICEFFPPGGANLTLPAGSCSGTTGWCTLGAKRDSCSDNTMALASGEVCMGAPQSSSKSGSATNPVQVPNAVKTTVPPGGSSSSASAVVASAAVVVAAVLLAVF